VEATGGLDGIGIKDKKVYLDNGTVSAIGKYGVGIHCGTLYIRSGNTVYCKGKEAGIKCTELAWDKNAKPGSTLIAESSDGWDIYSDEEVELLKGQVAAITGGVGTNNGTIKIGYTKATDFIKMSKCAGTVVVKGIMSDGINFYSDTIPDASVLWGKTLRPTYKIAYNGNGGSGAMAAQPCSFVASQALTPNTFTRYGYAFTGWNTMADGSEKKYRDEEVVRNLTSLSRYFLFAQWAKLYNVQYEVNGTIVDALTTSYAKLNVNFDGEGVTAVESIENNRPILSSDTIYNLAGQKVGADYKGIVIMNGKKVLKK
jgi:hypothetical protein